MNENGRSAPNRDLFSSSDYTGFVDELARVVNLNVGLVDALTNYHYMELSMHLAEVLDLDTGLRAALHSSPSNKNASRTEIPVGVDVETRATAKPSSTPAQESLLPEDSRPVYELPFSDVPSSPIFGFRRSTACQVSGITYRQLDYWARTGLVEPSVHAMAGSENQRLYSFKDILILKVVKRLLDTGVELQNIRMLVKHLRRRGMQDLARITLFSDGTTVYECTSAEEVVDLLQGEQGVFGIAVTGAIKEIVQAMADLPLGNAERKEIAGAMENFSSEKAERGTVQTPENCRNITA